MAKTIDYYIQQAKMMEDNDRSRDIMFQKYADAWHCDWNLPPDFVKLQGATKQIDTDPHDAIATAVRVLTGKFPTLKMTPLLADTANKKKANDWETNLKWQLMCANRRRPATVQADFLQSALTFGTIVAQVVDLDAQIAQLKKLKRNASSWEMLRRISRYAVINYLPCDVHVRYSSFMPVALTIHQMRTPQSILDDFPDTTGLDPTDTQPVDYWEYWDLKSRAIWVNDKIVILKPSDHDLPFLPFVCMMGGSTLESNSQDAYHPLLYSVIKSGQWESSNTFRSMAATDAIWNFARNRWAEEGSNPSESTVIDSVAPNVVAKVPPGNILKPLPYPSPDPAVESVMAGLTSAIQKSTVSSVLQGAGEGLGTAAFATLNLMTLTAVGALKPWRELTERALAEMFTMFLLWAADTKESIVAYGTGKKDAGETYVIEWDEIEPDGIYLEVTLAPDLPTNKQAQAMTAIQLKSAALLDDETALEEMGYEDPQSIMDNIVLQQMGQTYVEAWVQDRQLEVQAKQMELQMAAQGQQAQADQNAQAQADAMQQTQMMNQGGMSNADQGGIPYQMAAPAETREQITGVAANGVPLAEGFLP